MNTAEQLRERLICEMQTLLDGQVARINAARDWLTQFQKTKAGGYMGGREDAWFSELDRILNCAPQSDTMADSTGAHTYCSDGCPGKRAQQVQTDNIPYDCQACLPGRCGSLSAGFGDCGHRGYPE